MHNTVKVFIALAAALALTACGEGIKLDAIDKSYSTDTIFADAHIPQLSGLGSAEAEEEINGEYREKIGGLLEEFSCVARESGDKSEFSVQTTPHLDRKGFYSVVTQVESAPAGSHRTLLRITNNIDTVKKERVPLSGLFSGEEYIDMLGARILEVVESNPDKYSGLWEKPKLTSGQEYYINESNLVLYYPPYELSYYERGYVEIPVPLSDISGYLKDEYRFLAE